MKIYKVLTTFPSFLGKFYNKNGCLEYMYIKSKTSLIANRTSWDIFENYILNNKRLSHIMDIYKPITTGKMI